MAGKWYVLRNGVTQYGPYEEEQLAELARDGRVVVTDMLWQEGTPDWVAASSVTDLFPFQPIPSTPPPPPRVGPQDDYGSTKIVAGVTAIALGGFGVHKFILGATKPGLITLAITVFTCCAMLPATGAIGIAEGIIYLTMSDEEFYRTYIIGKKEWF